eukprot:CAMPEP_0202375180 /NCGR_PEP_ID=MMETSP1127-20130417/5880_1 /ASSEMBLY_ACC=CAM_ASM_000462 /TAXON_ID=3047 /ORGANISM="Dunaliella tertiolecta, Strain CCMP1320" /LENGTH=473 /DNA_ID=CAMNT_0048972569 /DNA_START=225 /DNA_END=1649 /DNA_ORIENTATION=-
MWSDFGGKREAADADSIETASREFAEETLGVFGGVSVDPAAVKRSADEMAARLRSGDRSLCSVHQLRKGAYHMYACMVTYIDPIFFELAMQQNDGPQLPDLPFVDCSPSTRAEGFQQHAVESPALGQDQEQQEILTSSLSQQQQQQQQQPRSRVRQRKSVGKVHGAEKRAFVWVALEELLKCVQAPRGTYFYNSSRRIAPGQLGIWGSRSGLQLHPCFASSLRIAKATGLLEVVQACRSRPLPLPPPTSGAYAPEHSMQPERSRSALAPCTPGQEGLALGNGDRSLSHPGAVGLVGADADSRSDHASCLAQAEDGLPGKGVHKRPRESRKASAGSLPTPRHTRQCVDVVGAAALAAKQWALHHQQQSVDQATEGGWQQACEALRPTAEASGWKNEEAHQGNQSAHGGMSSDDDGNVHSDRVEMGSGGGGGRAVREQVAKGGLQPCHMLYWLARGGAEAMGLQLPPAAHKWLQD